MSAPIGTRLPQKDIISSLTKTHLSLCSVLIFLTIFTFMHDSFLSIVKYRLFVIKVITAVIAICNVAYYSYSLQIRAFSKSTGIGSKIGFVVKNGLLLFCSSIFFHILAILFGAPLFQSSAETFHLGMAVSVTVVLPVLCVTEGNSSRLTRIFVYNSPELGTESIVYFSSVASIVGTWLGAFPIPLDWDRPWQEWPITCFMGSIIGYCVGLIIGVGHLNIKYHQTKRIKIT